MLSPNNAGKRQANSITTLEDLRGRCVIDDECWIWRMAKSGGKEPRAWFVDPETGKGRVWLAGRLALRLATGKNPKGTTYRPICMASDCINPEHIKVASRAEVGKFWGQSDRLKGNPRVIAANTAIGRKYAKLTLADVQMVRSSPESGVAIAKRLGVDPKLISDVRRHQRWKNAAVPNSSVFSWRPAA